MPDSWEILVVLVGLSVIAAPLTAQDRYVDASGRFTLTIPPGWEARSTDVDAVTVTNGSAQVTLMLPPTGAARLLLDQLAEEYQEQWSDWTLGRRDSMQVVGLEGQTITATGRDARGVNSFLRISSATAPTGPVVVISTVPREDFNGLRPTIEAIEGSIVLGTRIRAPNPTVENAKGIQVSRVFLGVGTRALESAEIRALGLRTTDGAMVLQLYPGGPADEAGIVVGDVIIAVDGGTIISPSVLTDVVARHHAGDALIVSVMRQGRRGDLRVVLRTAPER